MISSRACPRFRTLESIVYDGDLFSHSCEKPWNDVSGCRKSRPDHPIYLPDRAFSTRILVLLLSVGLVFTYDKAHARQTKCRLEMLWKLG